ncbi:MAG: single-stranded DNA-binding protein [Candidatus Cyclobacteriaceae bacterium M2_1C_046]
MNALRNRVQLIGRLGNDPEVKTLESGKTLASFSIATSDYYYNDKGERQEDTQWHQVVAWGKKAELVSKHLKKGEEVALEGKLMHRSYENGKGETKYITEINMSELHFMGNKKSRQSAEAVGK